MATTTMFALSNPGGKRVRIKSRKKATMARRRRRRGRRNPGMEGLSAAFMAAREGSAKKSKKRRKKAKRKGAKRTKRAKTRKAKTRRAKTRKGKARKRKSSKRSRAAKKAARTRARKKAARRAAGRKAARRAKRKGSRKKASRRKGGKKRASRRKGSKKRKGSRRARRSYGRRPKKGIYRPYARLRRGRRARFGNRTKKRMAALGLASVRGGKYTLNPRRRRRKNPMARRRSRRRRNPFGVVRGVKGLFTKGNAKKYAKLGVGAMLGMAVARGGPAVLGRLPVVGGFLAPDTPVKAVLGSAVALGLGAMLARKVKLVPSEMITAGVIGGAGIVAAGILKILSARVPALRMIPGVAGMGDVVSPSQLVAGEAIFGGSGVGDYLQLSGPVPEQYFAGGLNDYVEFQNRAAGVAAEAASAAQVDWSPGVETSF